MSIRDTIIVLCIVGAMSLVGNLVGYNNSFIDAAPGMAFLIAVSLIGILMGKYLPGGIPAAAYVVTLACILTYPSVPGSATFNAWMTKVNFMSLTTPILAYAGISIGKDLDAFKTTGWRIVILACVVFTGTFIGSAMIAEIILRYLGQI